MTPDLIIKCVQIIFSLPVVILILGLVLFLKYPEHTKILLSKIRSIKLAVGPEIELETKDRESSNKSDSIVNQNIEDKSQIVQKNNLNNNIGKNRGILIIFNRIIYILVGGFILIFILYRFKVIDIRQMPTLTNLNTFSSVIEKASFVMNNATDNLCAMVDVGGYGSATMPDLYQNMYKPSFQKSCSTCAIWHFAWLPDVEQKQYLDSIQRLPNDSVAIVVKASDSLQAFAQKYYHTITIIKSENLGLINFWTCRAKNKYHSVVAMILNVNQRPPDVKGYYSDSEDIYKLLCRTYNTIAYKKTLSEVPHKGGFPISADSLLKIRYFE